MKFLLLSLVMLSSIAYAETGKILFSRGDVKTTSGNAKKNAVLKIGDIIETGAKSLAVVQLPQGNKVKVGANSKLKIEALPKTKDGQTKLSLLKGDSFIKVLKSKVRGKKSKFVLRTKTTSMGVRGTEFFASYGSGKDVWMCVNEGVVAVRSKDEKKSTLVKEGEGIVVKGGSKTSDPKPLEWTKKLNWNMDPSRGDLTNRVSIESAYSDLLDEDYD